MQQQHKQWKEREEKEISHYHETLFSCILFIVRMYMTFFEEGNSVVVCNLIGQGKGAFIHSHLLSLWLSDSRLVTVNYFQFLQMDVTSTLVRKTPLVSQHWYVVRVVTQDA